MVLTVDRIDALGDAILIARRSKHIALQAVLVSMGQSLAAMIVAALGLLPPAAGAVVQEIIDVLAIGIALRAVLPVAMQSLDIEIPALQGDLGSLGDTFTTATKGVTDTAAGPLDRLTAVGDQLTGAAAGVPENVPDIPATVDSATEAVPAVTEALQAGAGSSK